MELSPEANNENLLDKKSRFEGFDFLRTFFSISIEYGSDSPPLCGEKKNLQSESLGSGADPQI